MLIKLQNPGGVLNRGGTQCVLSFKYETCAENWSCNSQMVNCCLQWSSKAFLQSFIPDLPSASKFSCCTGIVICPYLSHLNKERSSQHWRNSLSSSQLLQVSKSLEEGVCKQFAPAVVLSQKHHALSCLRMPKYVENQDGVNGTVLPTHTLLHYYF